jgi:hypothetical protein
MNSTANRWAIQGTGSGYWNGTVSGNGPFIFTGVKSLASELTQLKFIFGGYPSSSTNSYVNIQYS